MRSDPPGSTRVRSARTWTSHPRAYGGGKRNICVHRSLRALGLIFVALLAACGGEGTTPPAAPQTANPSDDWQALIVRQDTDKSFEDVVFELEFAITERNYRITGRNTIGQALRDRGYTDFPDAEVIHFCSLERARLLFERAPSWIALMPCRISVHVEDGRTVVQGNLLPAQHEDPTVQDFARETNALIGEIIEFATYQEN